MKLPPQEHEDSQIGLRIPRKERQERDVGEGVPGRSTAGHEFSLTSGLKDAEGTTAKRLDGCGETGKVFFVRRSLGCSVVHYNEVR